MAGFGGSIKLTGEDEYKKALSQITQGLREVSSEMKLTTAQYDASDKKAKDLKTAQNELNTIFQKQKAEVDKLRSAYDTFKSKIETQVQTHQKLVTEYEKEKAELQRLEKTVGTTSQKYQDQKSKVESLAQEVAKSSKNTDDNAKALSKMSTALNNAESDLYKTEKEMKSLGDETKKTGDGFTVFKGILANLGTQAINTAINGLKNLGNAFINVGKQAISSYADYEQLIGGVETLFGDSAKIVEGYANEAYKTAGVSANEYMSTVTSFSASLLSSLDGDTKKAAEYSNRALIDMSDNANKMGTDMSMIQNAYQGFAKQNYTMLDNLKLGYGGTKTEMQRLIKEASQMTDVQEKLNISVQDGDMSFANIVNAISVVQSKMGIMGTTSLEASSTISGSVNSMKASWKNLLTGIADDNADFGKLIDNFVESIVTVGKNLLPRIQTVISGIGKLIQGFAEKLLPEILKTLPSFVQETLPVLISSVQELIKGVLTALPDLMKVIAELIPQIAQTLLTLLPQLIDVGIKVILELIQGITQALPQLIKMLPDIIMQIVNTLVDNLPLILDTGIELIFALIDGIVEALPDLIDKIPEIIDKLIVAITDNLPKIIEAGITLIVKLAEGLIKAIPQLVSKIPQIISSLINGIKSFFSKIFSVGGELLGKVKDGIVAGISKITEVGKNLVQGLWNGINNAKDWVLNKIKGFGESILNGIKSFFGIKSPSKLFRDEIGQNLALGIGEGFSDEMNNVAKEMENSIPTQFDTNATIGGATGPFNSSINSSFTYDNMVLAFQEALASMKIELDDEEAGRFVRRTVEQAIYN